MELKWWQREIWFPCYSLNLLHFHSRHSQSTKMFSFAFWSMKKWWSVELFSFPLKNSSLSNGFFFLDATQCHVSSCTWNAIAKLLVEYMNIIKVMAFLFTFNVDITSSLYDVFFVSRIHFQPTDELRSLPASLVVDVVQIFSVLSLL